jgi:hypothetical protein
MGPAVVTDRRENDVSGVRLFERLVICLCGHGLVQGLERVENRKVFQRC